MIEQLDGIFETVNYKDATTLKLYYNNENENYPSHWHMSCEIIMPTDNIYTIETPEKTVILDNQLVTKDNVDSIVTKE